MESWAALISQLIALMKLKWTQEVDNENNPYYEATSRVRDEEGDAFYYKVAAVHREGRLIWENLSDPATCSDECGPWQDPLQAAIDLDQFDLRWVECVAQENQS